MALRLSTGLRNRLLGITTEKISNGTFDSATTGWTASNATLSSVASGQAGNCLSIAESGSASPGQAYQDVTTKIGHLYRLSLYFKKGTADSGLYYIGTTGSPSAIFTSDALSDADWTQYTTYFIATATTTRITLESTDATAAETSLFDTVCLASMAHSLQDIFAGGFIYIYTGTQPSSANTAPSGTLIATFSNDGDGITFDDAASGVISKAAAETWTATVSENGTAGYFRLAAAGDLGTTNTTDERIDGAIATSGAEMNFANGISWAAESVQSLPTFQITLPTA